MTRRLPPRVLLVHPAFGADSFWNYRATCEAVGARYPAAPLGLITVAALLPPEWTLRLSDGNVRPIEDSEFEWADVVLTGGMLPQQRNILRIIDRAHAAGKPVVVGGPDPSSSPHVYASAEFRVIGEAEGVLKDFVSAWESGAAGGVFESAGFPDVSTSPVPRFDLLEFGRYLHVGVQYSRGCPFNCEFCDIIELYGRVPRAKGSPQMLAELDALYACGYRGHVDFVDDNLIGNRKALKSFLPLLIDWQRRHRYPFEFTTEATLNLADDAELLALLRDACFFAVFVGIESPDPETLVHMQKRQNTRRVLADSVQRIHRAGIFVNAGFILGFDTEKAGTAEAMIGCIEDTSIPVCMVGLLYALPNTQLTRRLEAEGRLFSSHDRVQSDEDADQCTSGLNFNTIRPREDTLADFRRVLSAVYEPRRYFARARAVGRMLDCRSRRFRQSLRHAGRDLRGFLFMLWRFGIRDRRVRRHWWHTMADCLLHNPRAIRYVGAICALYLHLGPFAESIVRRLDGRLSAVPANDDAARAPATAAPAAIALIRSN